MSYRRLRVSVTWHWSQNCSGWPVTDFQQVEEKPQAWTGQSLCEDCASLDAGGATAANRLRDEQRTAVGPLPQLA